MTGKTIPVLLSSSLDATADFYARLGFVSEGLWPDEYLVLRRPADGLELHFSLALGVVPTENLASCYIRFPTAADARDLLDQWEDRAADEARLTGLTETDYGLLEGSLTDPDGNLIRFGGAPPQ